MLTKAYGEFAMSKTRVYEWYKHFQDGREDVKIVELSGFIVIFKFERLPYKFHSHDPYDQA